MSLADLQRFISRATPRVEDVRSPDRTDIIRREHKDLSLRETIDALDALEFSVNSFSDRMQTVLKAEETKIETSVHSLFRIVDGIRVLSPPVTGAPTAQLDTGMAADEEGADSAAGWEEIVAEARTKGGDFFKKKEFDEAVAQYTIAIRAAPRGEGEAHTLFSNRSAALLQKGEIKAAVADAQRCVELAPEWPKGRFRTGCSFRDSGRLDDAVDAFRAGEALEKSNTVWEAEIEKTQKLQWSRPELLVPQLLLNLLPELLSAWVRGGDQTGVLHVQINGELSDMGASKWWMQRDKRAAKAQMRYCFVSRKEHLANLAANLQDPPKEGVAVTDLLNVPLKIADVAAFLAAGDADGTNACIHIDIQNGDGKAKMKAILCRIPCDDQVRKFVPSFKAPPAPKGSVEDVLKLQKVSGFPKALPRYLGFQAYPGDLNFPVIDLERDAPGARSNIG